MLAIICQWGEHQIIIVTGPPFTKDILSAEALTFLLLTCILFSNIFSFVFLLIH